MTRTRLHQLALYLTLASLLLMPLRAFADFSGAATESHGDMPCHSDTMPASGDTPSAYDSDTKDCCGNTGPLMDCSHCFTTMATSAIDFCKTPVHSETRPVFITKALKAIPLSNLYKPPRILV